MTNQSNEKKTFYPSSPAKIGTRHVVTFMLFLGMANAYVMRTNMSVAIVAMVNHTQIEKSGGENTTVSFADECPGRINETESDQVIVKSTNLTFRK